MRHLNWHINKILFNMLIIIFPIVADAAQVCNSTIPQTAPTEDFIDHDNGLATHLRTGLMWKVCPEGTSWIKKGQGYVPRGKTEIKIATKTLCNGLPTGHFWKGALDYIVRLNKSIASSSKHYGKFSNWRLPNVKEFLSIAQLNCKNPALNTNIFPEIPGDFRFFQDYSNYYDYLHGKNTRKSYTNGCSGCAFWTNTASASGGSPIIETIEISGFDISKSTDKEYANPNSGKAYQHFFIVRDAKN